MIETIKEISLKRAMEKAKVYQMPKPLAQTTRIWAKAFVEVTKWDCSTSYCIAENDGDGNPHILYDFGNCSKIVKIDEVYPYDFINKRDIPDIKKPSDVAIYLIGHGIPKDEVMKLLTPKNEDGTDKPEEEIRENLDKVQKLIFKVAIIEYNKNKEIEAENE